MPLPGGGFMKIFIYYSAFRDLVVDLRGTFETIAFPKRLHSPTLPELRRAAVLFSKHLQRKVTEKNCCELLPEL